MSQDAGRLYNPVDMWNEDAPSPEHAKTIEHGCPIPNTHRRLDEAHALWHQAASAYHDPEGFRVNLNAAIQALRNVTFVLKKEQRAIPEFENWYAPWEAAMRQDTVLRWLVNARNVVVKEGDLKTRSTARATLVPAWNSRLCIAERDVDPLMPTEVLASSFPVEVVPGHLRETGVVMIERRWVAGDLEEWELLDALAYCYGAVARLIQDAHRASRAASHRVTGKNQEQPPLGVSYLDGCLPCMTANETTRTIAVNLHTGGLLVVSVQLPRRRVAS